MVWYVWLLFFKIVYEDIENVIKVFSENLCYLNLMFFYVFLKKTNCKSNMFSLFFLFFKIENIFQKLYTNKPLVLEWFHFFLKEK